MHPSSKNRRATMFTLLLALLAPLTSRAQEPTQSIDATPTLSVSGSAEVNLPASKASLSIGITTTAATSSQASADNAERAKAVNAALTKAGLQSTELTGSSFTIALQTEYDPVHQRQRRVGYQATDTLQIETTALQKLGLLIDAAVAAGATDVSDIHYSAKDAELAVARQQVLAQAVADARSTAEAMAHAAGGSVGKVLLLSTGSSSTPFRSMQEVVVTAARVAAPASTQIVPTQVTVSAEVTARWAFEAR